MRKTIFLYLLLCLCSASAFAQKTISDIDDSKNPFKSPERKIVGKVIRVADGDTITILDADKQQYKIRFEGIDAPESKQDFGQKSKQNLSDWVFGKEVTVITSKIDKYKRHVGKVLVTGTDVNLEQIKAGLAWHYKKYADEQIEADRIFYAEEETKARNAKIGLWADPKPTPPWDWRARQDNDNLEGVPENAVLGNKNSKIYHTPGCSTYAKVSAKNRVIFISEQEAVSKGYRIAKNCTSSLSKDEMTVNSAAPSSAGNKPANSEQRNNNSATGRTYIRGPRGGCYYLNSSGKKTYVDRGLCN